jgi:hypothetical protein
LFCRRKLCYIKEIAEKIFCQSQNEQRSRFKERENQIRQSGKLAKRELQSSKAKCRIHMRFDLSCDSPCDSEPTLAKQHIPLRYSLAQNRRPNRTGKHKWTRPLIGNLVKLVTRQWGDLISHTPPSCPTAPSVIPVPGFTNI